MSGKRPFPSDLVERAQQGDDRALQEVIDRLKPMLRAFFTSRIGRRAEVDDLVQNTLLRLHRGLSDLNDLRRLKSFVMKGAVFELQDYYRGRYRGKERLFDPKNPPVIGESEAEAAANIDVERMLSVLSEKARKILEMRELGYRYEEIADALDTTEAAIKMQVKRAFDKMRDEFDDR